MAEIALRTYIEQLDNLIERKQVDEAVAHCRHILSLYPKHLDTYRMLGKALLEKGRHGDAADIFQRVLSVVPDDFIAHVGMSIIREDEANLDAAIWHMERAFETAPSNGAIQQELCRLYGRRDGVVPAKARLTRGALARMYSQGGLYPQAEAELKAALAEQPDRIDLMTVLAYVYSQTEQPAQAAQACAEILQKLPYSLEANRILLAIFQQQGRANDAAVYRHRLQALDPYEAFVDPAANGSAARRIEPDKVAIERLDYVPGMEDSGSPDWLNSIGVRFEETMSRPATEAAPDWLTPAQEAPQASSAVPEPGAADLPDWLRELQAAPSAEPVAAPDWLNQLDTIQHAPVQDSPEGEVPEWMRPALPASSADATMPSLRTPTTQPGEADADLPDWLAAAAAGVAIVSGAAREGPAKPVEPAEIPATGTPVPAVEASNAEVPEWLKSAAPGEVGEDMPDWLHTLSAPQSAEGAGETMPPAAPADDQLPDWLQTAIAPPSGNSELPDWMNVETGAEQPAQAPVNLTGSEQPLAVPELDAETHEWLAARSAAAVEAGLSLAGPEAAPERPAAPGSLAAEPARDLPSWLQSNDDQPASLAPSEAGAAGSAEPAQMPEMPDWLHAVAASAPTPDQDTPEWPPKPSAVQPRVTGPAKPPIELPDYLQPASPEAIARAEQPFAVDAAEPDFTGEAQQPDIVIPAEIPDWLRALAPLSPDPITPELAEPTGSPLDQPDWLLPLAPAAAESEAAAPAEAIIPEGVPPEDLASAPPAPIEITPTDLPPWAEPGEPGPTDTITSWLAGRPAVAPPPTEAPAEEPAAASLDVFQPRAVAPSEAASPISAITPTDLPPWAEPSEPGPTDTITSWLAGRPAPAGEAAAQVPIEPAPEAAGPSELDGDEALRWLEKLAAQQGASPDELLTTPEERAEATPTWLVAPSADKAASLQAASTSAELAAKAAPERPAQGEPEVPTWLAGALAGTGATASAAGVTEPEAIEPATLHDQERQPDEAPSLDTWLSQAEQALPEEPLADTAPSKLHMPPDAAAESLAAALVPQPAALELAGGEAMPPAAPVSAGAGLEAADAPRWPDDLAAQQGTGPDELRMARETTEASQPEPVEPASLEELAASVPAEPAGFDTVAADIPSSAAAVAAIDEDEALRWLEGLAAQQGAVPEELISAPEDRPAETPAWISATIHAAEARPETGRLDWLPAQPEPAGPVSTTASSLSEPASDAPAQPAQAAGDDEAALRWLNNLAAQQDARPDDLLTTGAEQGTGSQATDLAGEPASLAEPEPAAGVAPPDWLRAGDAALVEPEAGPIGLDQAPAAAPDPQPDVAKLSLLADRLAAARRVKEMEIEARFAQQRAQQEEARRQVQERMTSWRQAIEAEPAPELPAVESIQPPPVAARAELPPAPPQPDYAAEVERLSRQIESGEELDEAARRLENLAADQQAPAAVLRLLGDVSLKRNRLQEALDAYRSALARL
ncbi:MAG: hypothetical protein IT318_07430 [Anaerolineales bacterium]|nr:hypothetical protein [Anaerolineales bacterium]